DKRSIARCWQPVSPHIACPSLSRFSVHPSQPTITSVRLQRHSIRSCWHRTAPTSPSWRKSWCPCLSICPLRTLNSYSTTPIGDWLSRSTDPIEITLKPNGGAVELVARTHQGEPFPNRTLRVVRSFDSKTGIFFVK